MKTNDKYYFVKCRWRYHIDGSDAEWGHFNIVIKEHPMLWLKDARTNYYTAEYLIDFYEEISEEMYYEVKETIGK